MAATLNALDEIQARLLADTPSSYLLWDTHAKWPKSEEEISDYLAIELEQRLRERAWLSTARCRCVAVDQAGWPSGPTCGSRPCGRNLSPVDWDLAHPRRGEGRLESGCLCIPGNTARRSVHGGFPNGSRRVHRCLFRPSVRGHPPTVAVAGRRRTAGRGCPCCSGRGSREATGSRARSGCARTGLPSRRPLARCRAGRGHLSRALILAGASFPLVRLGREGADRPSSRGPWAGAANR